MPSPDWRWPAVRLAIAFAILASFAVGVSVPYGAIHVCQAAVAVALIALSLFALVATDVKSVLRLGVASAFAALAVFGFATPWAMCRWGGTAFVGKHVCSPDCEERDSAQRRRLVWAACLVFGAAALMLLPQRAFDGGTSSVLRLLQGDVELVALLLGLR